MAGWAGGRQPPSASRASPRWDRGGAKDHLLERRIAMTHASSSSPSRRASAAPRFALALNPDTRSDRDSSSPRRWRKRLSPRVACCGTRGPNARAPSRHNENAGLLRLRRLRPAAFSRRPVEASPAASFYSSSRTPLDQDRLQILTPHRVPLLASARATRGTSSTTPQAPARYAYCVALNRSRVNVVAPRCTPGYAREIHWPARSAQVELSPPACLAST